MVYPTLTNVSHSITTMKVIMMNEEKKRITLRHARVSSSKATEKIK